MVLFGPLEAARLPVAPTSKAVRPRRYDTISLSALAFLAIWIALSVLTASVWATFRAAQRRAAERRQALAGVTSDEESLDDEDASG